MSSIDDVSRGRDLLVQAEDRPRQRRCVQFRWPELDEFNWAIDHFDRVATAQPERTALWVVNAGRSRRHRRTYAELAARSNQVANFLRDQGVRRGDRVLLMVGNIVPLWEVMLAAMKLGRGHHPGVDAAG